MKNRGIEKQTDNGALSDRIEKIENNIKGLTARVVQIELTMREFVQMGLEINQVTQVQLGAYTAELSKIYDAIQRFEALAVTAEGRA